MINFHLEKEKWKVYVILQFITFILHSLLLYSDDMPRKKYSVGTVNTTINTLRTTTGMIMKVLIFVLDLLLLHFRLFVFRILPQIDAEMMMICME